MGATVVVVAAYVLAPTLHRTNLSAVPPGGHRAARAAVGLPARPPRPLERYGGPGRSWCWPAAVRPRPHRRRPGPGRGLPRSRRRPASSPPRSGPTWSIVAVVVLGPQLPTRSLTPPGEFVARATAPLAVLPQLARGSSLSGSSASCWPSRASCSSWWSWPRCCSCRWWRPASSPDGPAVPGPGHDRRPRCSSVAQQGVVDLSPAAAHIAPALAFVFIALVFALERIGTPSVTRVNVDRRVLLALLAGATLFFVTEAPTSPYRQPWAWGSRDAVDGARIEAADRISAARRRGRVAVGHGAGGRAGRGGRAAARPRGPHHRGATAAWPARSTWCCSTPPGTDLRPRPLWTDQRRSRRPRPAGSATFEARASCTSTPPRAI